MSKRKPFDQYPTEAAVTRSLLRLVPGIGGVVVEACSGDGLMARIIQQHPGVTAVVTNDIDRDQPSLYHCDAADPRAGVWKMPADWIVTNPPFLAAPRILPVAIDKAAVGVACLLRLTYLEPAQNRFAWLDAHADCMTHLIVFGQPRPSFTGDGQTDSVTTAWMVWQRGFSWKRLGAAPPFAFEWRWRD